MSFVVFFSLSLYFPLLRLTRLAVLPKQLFFSSLPLCSSPLLSSVRPSWLLQVAALHHKTSVRLGFLSLFRSVPALSLFQNLLIFPLVFFRLQSHSFLVTRSCLALVFTSITTSRYLGLLTSLPPGSYLCRTMRHRGDAEVSVRVCVCVCSSDLLIELLVTPEVQPDLSRAIPELLCSCLFQQKHPVSPSPNDFQVKQSGDETLVTGRNIYRPTWLTGRLS